MRTTKAAIPLLAFWLAITGSLKPVDVALGVIFSLILGAWAARYLWGEDAPVLTLRQAGRFVIYFAHLLWDIVRAAIQVGEVVLDPRMPIAPIVIAHRTSFSRDVSRVAFANSITLTPGTLTVDVDGNTFYIHCLAERFADDIASGDLERRILRVFER
ncbi:MAG: Na+/H+ antiporter subunit E [Coriobacteriia bacterium]|nr:Na+/H+ antiporter subunit E [Coriobacteriia bacterium]